MRVARAGRSALFGVLAGLPLLALGARAEAALIVSAAVGGTAAAGSTVETFDSLALGSAGGTTASGVVVRFEGGGAAAVQGSGQTFAAPFLTGTPSRPSGPDTTTYLTAGSSAAAGAANASGGGTTGDGVTLLLPGLRRSFGLLWGSVDSYNSLSFYRGDTLVGSLTGNDVTPNANGDQGAAGTFYVNVNSTLDFDRVLLRSGGFNFEFDDIAFGPMTTSVAAATAEAVPEPASILGLVSGLGLLGVLGLTHRRLRA